MLAKFRSIWINFYVMYHISSLHTFIYISYKGNGIEKDLLQSRSKLVKRLLHQGHMVSMIGMRFY